MSNQNDTFNLLLLLNSRGFPLQKPNTQRYHNLQRHRQPFLLPDNFSNFPGFVQNTDRDRYIHIYLFSIAQRKEYDAFH